ncbi:MULTISPECIES: heparinase II/III domain-containing protein [unclassified Pseudoclavibacter]|uniref:heparinase II/III domain-containing protein n=1 Tax=unclassified Pseudoclavibacter TaxID=2615177 RepID=UPI0035A84787
MSVAVKGGHNDENHNHNDVGTFLVASDGVPVIVDAGRPSYDARTFSERRYELWPMRSEWHNVPLVAGRGQPTGREYAADVVGVQTGNAPSLELELAGAYDVAGLESWRREVLLDRERAEVRVHDAWRWASADAAGAPAPAPAPTQLRMLLAGDVAITPDSQGDDSAAITPLGGAPRVHVTWTGTATATLTPIEPDDPMLTDVWGPRLVRLDLDVADRSTMTVTVRQEHSTPPFGDTNAVGDAE